MNIIDSVGLKGDGRVMEDTGGSMGAYAWVLDGATGLQDKQFFDPISDASWIVNKLNEYLKKKATSNRSLIELLRKTSALLFKESNRLHSLDKIPLYAMPSYALAIIKVKNRKIEYLVVGDCYVVISYKDKTIPITDQAFHLNSLENRLYSQAVLYDKEKLIKSRRANMNKLGGYKIGTIDGTVFSQVQESELEIMSGTQILLCTDGFARAVERYKIYTWASIFKFPLRDIAAKIREQESHHSKNTEVCMFKNSDDLFALKIQV